MFKGFTENAVRVINLAEREADALGSDFLGAEHILLGLLQQDTGLGGHVLRSLGFSAGNVRQRLVAFDTGGQRDAADLPSHGSFEGLGHPSMKLRPTPRAREVLARAVDEALILGSGSIGTEHILLSLSGEDGSLAMRILEQLDAELPRSDEERFDRQLDLELRNGVIRAISASDNPPPATPPVIDAPPKPPGL